MQLLKVVMLVDVYIQLSCYTRRRSHGGSRILHYRILGGVALAARLHNTVMTVMSVSERYARIGVSIPRASSRRSIFVSQNTYQRSPFELWNTAFGRGVLCASVALLPSGQAAVLL
jgi:hypothetical protein